ncbi:hypothetical protein [Natrialba asiatica]|uniref:Uncharacterized protein n=1 Tax=Natrialba asiatica (strain ATCC 700177 / DSM 12278 / JCM 9576 / FERM P-10747 / NBRC 102637 / 172P1) TaxID=29540 RepID=M0AIE4_NATA1|nr:hypothetical protein [Natrialba asiatica]ELY98121.1 hypothetical protein C481_19335 [Natrialba asiatica DSM 12278]
MYERLVGTVRSFPIAAALELGSVLVCLGLFVGTFAVLVSGPPAVTSTAGGAGAGSQVPLAWLAIIGTGAAFVVFWTALVPLFQRVQNVQG